MVHLLDATKEVLEYLRTWSQQLIDRGKEAPRAISQTHAGVRRLRDQMRRTFTAQAEPWLDLSEDDENLLAACAVHALGVTDRMLDKARDRSKQEVDWLESRRACLARWALALASRSIQRVPHERPIDLATVNARRVMGEIDQRCGRPAQAVESAPRGLTRFGDAGGNMGGTYPDASPAENRAPAPWERPAAEPLAHGRAEPRPAAPAPAPVRASEQVFARPAPVPANQDLFGEEPVASGGDAPARGGSSGAQSGGLRMRESSDTDLVNELGTLTLLEVEHLRDPRVRALALLYARAYDRALSAGDYRSALIQLGSLTEAGILDHALAYRRELGLGPAIEGWSLEQVLVKALADKFGPLERGTWMQLTTVRSLLRPAIQIVSPIAVTPSSFRQLHEGVKRILRSLQEAAQPQA